MQCLKITIILLTDLQFGQGLEGMVCLCSMQHQLGLLDWEQGGPFLAPFHGGQVGADHQLVAQPELWAVASVPTHMCHSRDCLGFLTAWWLSSKRATNPREQGDLALPQLYSSVEAVAKPCPGSTGRDIDSIS